MPMWAQTYLNGRRYYKEHRGSRGDKECPAHGGSIRCHVADDQIGKIIEAIELGPRWEEQVLSIISVKDEVERDRQPRGWSGLRTNRTERWCDLLSSVPSGTGVMASMPAIAPGLLSGPHSRSRLRGRAI